MRRTLAVTLLLAISALPTFAQSPASDWRTIILPHFRVHYTVEDEAWARRVATRLESIRDILIKEVGYAPPQKVDILISDPLAVPNGFALPLLRSPRMVLYPTAPTPESGFGAPMDWAAMVTLHEYAHLVHLLRPSRNRARHLLEKILPTGQIGPIPTLTPRWVQEGYATLLEGKLTGAGRPNSDLRAAILRRWAQAGRLPSYDQLAADTRSWLGMSMAYLGGSAYLEWLAERAGPDSLKQLWARLTARADRDFDAAFEGVFGDRPRPLYSRFCAELTSKALEVQKLRAPIRREGELWQDLTWSTGEPALSPDGSKLVVVVRGRGKPSRLVIWSTGRDLEGEKRWQEQIDTTLARDPDDVAPVRGKPLPRKPLFELVPRNRREPLTTRFTRDGKAVLFVSFEADGNGFLHPDVFRWRFEEKRVERITRLADVRDIDPAPDGRWAVGVRARHGFSQLVRIDLQSGAVQAVTEPSLDVVYSSPRPSPSGDRIAYTRGTEKGWALVVRTLADGSEKEVDIDGMSLVAMPSWFSDGTSIAAVAGQGGFVDIARFAVDGHGGPVWLTHTDGAASAPAVTPDGKGLFFLALEPDGLALRHMELAPAPGPGPDLPVALAPAVPPLPPQRLPVFTSASVPAPQTYGLGRQEISPLTGTRLSPSGRSWEVGLRVGDVVGKLDTLAIGALSAKGEASGGTLAAVWRGWPVAVGVQAFGSKERPSDQARVASTLDRRLDVNRAGVDLRAEWARVWNPGRFELFGGALWNRVRFEPQGDVSVGQRLGYVGAHVDRGPSQGQWTFTEKLSLQAVAGQTGDSSWRRFRGSATVGADFKGTGVSVTWERRTVRGAPSAVDRIQLGGLPATILPDSVQSMRVFVPALPVGTAFGDDYEGQRADLVVGKVPLFFFERHRLWDAGHSPQGWLRLAGFSMDLVGRPQPLVRLPATTLTLGIARILDEPFKDKMRLWLAFVYRP